MEKIKIILNNWLYVFLSWVTVFIIIIINISVSETNKKNLTTFQIILSLIFILITIWLIILPFIKLFSSINKKIKTNKKKSIFKSKLLEFLSDEVLTAEEEEELDRLKTELNITNNEYKELRSEEFKKKINPILTKILELKRFSPEDEKILTSIAGSHRIKATFDTEFYIYRKLWEIDEKGAIELVPIEVDIRLTNGEECYFKCDAVWKQTKQIKKLNGYVGGSIGVRVSKGITLRVGKATPSYTEYEDIINISDGILYITNKKIIFVGSRKSTNITLGRLANYELYKDAILINKTSGKPDIFVVGDSVLIIDAFLQLL